MADLTDLEICKRIAEIEGFEFSVNGEHVFYKRDGWPCAYNPLTDDALCFKLMIKYYVRIVYEIGPNVYHARVNGLKGEYKYSDNPNKAICLAIIEANKDK